ncbi:MerR family transcriptional regulator [Weissella soli]|uniref:MerR family transcriptional regulator n=1 Tax=Weissella soli TaxID=155866 RepID=UPI0011BAF8B6|nr:MerR family transcriptional regulator [Weissella soli]MCT8394687.1 MerR family transcriptional regulator [Weissella soli]QEA35011.1 MerR family transcriptional regulator [Weissella soli]GJM48079.1 MerR family transcriptional regulator [Weissella soli]
MQRYTMQEVSEYFQIPTSTIRFYDKQGLLPLVERNATGQRVFPPVQMDLLQLIIHLKETDMSLRDIQKYMELVQAGDRTAKDRLAILTAHHAEVEAQIKRRQQALHHIEQKIARYSDTVNELTAGKAPLSFEQRLQNEEN